MINLDVTLRDGGYRNNFNFSPGDVVAHARHSVAAGFDWVEIAYRGGSAAGPAGLGPTGLGANSLIAAVANAIEPDAIGLIAHGKNLRHEDLVEVFDAGARLLRLCLPRNPQANDFDWITRARSTGFVVAANIVRISEQRVREAVDTATAAVDAGASVIYLADSNGAMRPDDVRRVVTTVGAATGAAIGFHAHDNLGLAMTNALAAYESGASWIDSAVRGMGKGPGNLRAEQWLAATQAEESQVNLSALLDLVRAVDGTWPEAAPTAPLPDLLLGVFNLPVDARSRFDAVGAHEWVATARVAAATR